mmetsp:Transcript_11456/g.32967  ORF Transcript_11456/g.32967 Transcript_11456/m.32967 type:complete len:97 (+) Transcript_11456:114-404(+)
MTRFLLSFVIMKVLCHSWADAWGLSSSGREISRLPCRTGEESRRGFLWQGFASSVAVVSTTANEAIAAETVGKDPDCDDYTCLGVWDGLLAGEHTR